MEAYIVKGYRTAVAKAKKGGFKNYRSDDMAVDVLKHLTPYSTMISINMEPVYGIVLAIIILDENQNLSYGFYIGFFMIFCSIILNGIMKLKNKNQ